MTYRVYRRVSTDKQDWDEQTHGIQTILDRKGISLESCIGYDEPAMSGTIMDRPVYKKMLSEVIEGDTIIVYEFSRLWRDMEEQSRATKMLCALGVRVESPVDGTIDDLENTLPADIKGVINQHEVRRLRRRTKEGIAAKKAKIAAGLDEWKGRGKDRQKRKTDGYKKEQERRRQLKINKTK